MDQFRQNTGIELEMDSILNTFDELVLSSVNYDADSNLTVMFEGFSNKSGKNLGEVIFNTPLAFFVMEEAVDAAAYSEDIFNSVYGFLKSFSQTIDPLEPVLHVSAFIQNSNLQHFRIIFRDEIVHVISLQNPIVTWAGGTNSPLNKPNT